MRHLTIVAMSIECDTELKNRTCGSGAGPCRDRGILHRRVPPDSSPHGATKRIEPAFDPALCPAFAVERYPRSIATLWR